MSVEIQNVDDLETVTLKSGATDDAAWVGGFFDYGGKNAEQSATIYFAVPPGDRLGKHVDTAEETQLILSGSGELLLDDGPKPVKPGDVFVLTEGTSHDLHNSGSEDLRVIAFFSKPQVEQHWDIETWPPDNSKITGSPNRG
ncbi:MAG TPA: cupin domain-containing protein [Mycobacteriales bacterium]|nr:cupin domain-containing protein [Mycobacteriales bacterium]